MRETGSRLDTHKPLEEEMIVTPLIRYAERSLPVRGIHLKEAVGIIVSRVLTVRHRLLKFENSPLGTGTCATLLEDTVNR